MAAHARIVHKALFDQGLKLTQLPYPLEWAESQVRIERMETPEVAGALKALGAKKLVENIKSAHEVYGKALGIPLSQPRPPRALLARAK